MSDLSFHYTPNECYVTPCLIVRALAGENVECGEIHGFQVIFHWGWWAVMLTWTKGAGA